MGAEPSSTYDRTSLTLYHLRVHAGPDHPFADYVTAAGEFNELLREHYRTVLGGLERLFGLRLDAEAFPAEGEARVLFSMFEDTAASYLAIRHPWHGYREALFQHVRRRPGELGEAAETHSARITELAADLGRAHLDLADAFLRELLGPNADATFTSADLHALGIDDRAPEFETWALENIS